MGVGVGVGVGVAVSLGVGVGDGEGVADALGDGVGEGVADAVALGFGVALAVALAVATATFAPCFHTSLPFDLTTVYTYPRHTTFWPTLLAFSVGPAATAKDGKSRKSAERPSPPTTSRRRTTF